MAVSGMESRRRERRRSGGDEEKGGEGQVERVEDGGRMRKKSTSWRIAQVLGGEREGRGAERQTR